MESRNAKRSPGRGTGRRSSERQGRRCRSRSRTPIQRRRSSRYSPLRRRTRSRSLSPYRSRDLHHRGQRSSSSESRRRVNDDVRRPQFRGPENSKVLEKAERDRTRIIVYQNESASYDFKFNNKRLTSRERNRITTNGNEYAGRRAYDRSSASRDRSLSPQRRNHETRRNSDGKNHGRDYDYDRNCYDKLERSRAAKERLNSRRRGSRDHRAYEKYDDKKSAYKRGSKDGRHGSDDYSKNKEQESENNEVENVDGSDESNENEEGGQSSTSDTVFQPTPPAPLPIPWMVRLRGMGPLTPRPFAPMRPAVALYPRYPPYGILGPLMHRPPFIVRHHPARYFAPPPPMPY